MSNIEEESRTEESRLDREIPNVSGGEKDSEFLIAQRYEAVRKIGAGGAANVYLCNDLVENRRVAIKVLNEDNQGDPVDRKRFENEIALTLGLHHKNIVAVYDHGRLPNGQLFLAMEFVEGLSLGSKLRGQEVPLDTCLDILWDVAAALQYAHEQGVIHRDLKPDNILIERPCVCKVSDFGLAKHLDLGMSLTKTGETVGTPRYMAPEQFRGEKADFTTDIYAYGLLAFELASGRRPFESDQYHTLANAHLLAELPDIQGIRGNIQNWYRDFVEICLEKKKKNRFSSFSDIMSILQKYAPREGGETTGPEIQKGKSMLSLLSWRKKDRL